MVKKKERFSSPPRHLIMFLLQLDVQYTYLVIRYYYF